MIEGTAMAPWNGPNDIDTLKVQDGQLVSHSGNVHEAEDCG